MPQPPGCGSNALGVTAAQVKLAMFYDAQLDLKAMD
jgi:hypothetical protein